MEKCITTWRLREVLLHVYSQKDEINSHATIVYMVAIIIAQAYVIYPNKELANDLADIADTHQRSEAHQAGMHQKTLPSTSSPSHKDNR
jgi:hypothetical protein